MSRVCWVSGRHCHVACVTRMSLASRACLARVCCVFIAWVTCKFRVQKARRSADSQCVMCPPTGSPLKSNSMSNSLPCERHKHSSLPHTYTCYQIFIKALRCRTVHHFERTLLFERRSFSVHNVLAMWRRWQARFIIWFSVYLISVLLPLPQK